MGRADSGSFGLLLLTFCMVSQQALLDLVNNIEMDLVNAEKEFIEKLEEDLNKCQLFYETLIAELLGQGRPAFCTWTNTHASASINRACVESSAPFPSSPPPGFFPLHEDPKDLAKYAHEIENYAILNTKALKNVLQKHDEVSRQPLLSDFTVFISRFSRKSAIFDARSTSYMNFAVGDQKPNFFFFVSICSLTISPAVVHSTRRLLPARPYGAFVDEVRGLPGLLSGAQLHFRSLQLP